ncbi:MAG: rod shape-determining protein MreD [Candidatus Dadabacteria bacterium]|nr:rod shape-determining protein MreD [Candidatus Dadabacteria bacterium]
MNSALMILFLAVLSLALITLQSTVLSPGGGHIYPDLNLIFIVFLAIYSEVRGSLLIAAGNGYLMDVLSGNLPGTFTLSRLSAYILVKSSSSHVYLKKYLVQGLVIFGSTVFTWLFIMTIIVIRGEPGLRLPLGEILLRGVVNTAVGVPLFWAAGKAYARLQR